MNSNEILVAIDKIAATSGKLDKQALVNGYAQFPSFLKVCEYAYNPFKTYGLRQIPGVRVPESVVSDADVSFDEKTWGILDDLIARRLTGTAARNAVFDEINRLSEASSDLFVRIIRKDLRAGFSESTCNKASKGLIPTFPYMRCSLPKDTDLSKWPWAKGVIVQEKADGMFANLDVEADGNVSLTSRQGSPLPIDHFPTIVEAAKKFLRAGTQSHGEILVQRNGVVLAREIGNGIVNSVLKGGSFDEGDVPVYMIWDQIPLDAVKPKGKCLVPYKDRLADIVYQVSQPGIQGIFVIDTKVVFSLEEAYKFAGDKMKEGKEGAILKNPVGTWKDGTSKDQIKIKLEFEVDLEIMSIIPGKVGTKNEGSAGSFACQSSDGKVKVDVTVKNDEVRARADEYVGKVIAVIANDLLAPSKSNGDYSLYLPRMAEADYRTDKTVADDLPRIIAAMEAAILGQSLVKEEA